MPSLFVNLTNHPSARWPSNQREAALSLADAIEDVAFPTVPPGADLAEVEVTAESVLARVPDDAACALVAGEWVLTTLLVQGLQDRGVRCVAATSARAVVQVSPDRKESRYRFVRFRDFPPLTRPPQQAALREREVVDVQGEAITVSWEPAHLEAHRADLLVPLRVALALAVEAALPQRGDPAVRCRPVVADVDVGWSRCVKLAAGDRSWWGRRPGREILSHLTEGGPRLTRHLCTWGRWEGPDHYRLSTLFPGTASPREIHDPNLPADEVAESIAFWTKHALVVAPPAEE